MTEPTLRLSQRHRRPSSYYVVVLAGTLLAMLFGLLIAVFPPSLMSRVAIVFGAGVVLFVGMQIPLRDEGGDRRGFLLLLVVTVFLSFLWPRYSYIKASEHLPRLNPLGLLEFLALLATIFFWGKSRTLRAEVLQAMRGSKAISASFLLFVIWRFIAACFGEQALPSLMLFAREVVYTFSFFAIGLVMGGRPRGVRLMAVTLAVAAALVSALAVVEYATHFNIFTRLAASDETGALGAQLAMATMEKVRAGAYRAQASFDHPILLAQFTAAFLPVMLQLLRGETIFLRRVFWLAGTLLLLAGTFAARSRTGVAVLALSLGLYLLLEIVSRMRSESRGRSLAAIITLSICLLTAATLVGPYLADVIVGRTATEMGSTNARLEMMAVALPQVMESPLVGYGQGAATYLAGMGSGYMVTLDSYYLSLLLDNGVPGMLLFAGLCVSIWLRSLSCAGRTPEKLLAGAFGIAVLAIFLGLAVVSIPNNAILVYLFGGAICAFSSRMNRELPTERNQPNGGRGTMNTSLGRASPPNATSA